MITGKEFIKIFVYTIILIVVIQLFRMDAVSNKGSVENIISREYDGSKAVKLNKKENMDFSENEILIIYNERDQELDNITTTLDYLKVKYELMNSLETQKKYDNYNMIIILEHNLTNLIDIENIINYASDGGGLIYLIDNSVSSNKELSKYSSIFGIKKVGKAEETNHVYFNTEILSGITGELNLDEPSQRKFKKFKFLDIELNSESKVHMESHEGQPLIWNKKHNKGKIMVVNISNYGEKEFRGLLTGSISIMKELFIYPIINAQVVFLDDFPADYNSKPDILEKNYGRSSERFILEIWWPDMVKLMEKHSLIYTGAYIQTYNDTVKAPFEKDESTFSATKQLGQDLLKYDGEIAFHGYNHQPLLYNQKYSDFYGYVAWENSDQIIKALNTGANYFKNIFPKYSFYTYVPPSNLLEVEAIPALRKAIPSIRTISGVYYGVTDDVDGKIRKEVFTQEFGVDKTYGVSLPRITSGAFYSEETRYSIASALTVNGIISHFMHPDDIQDPHRSNNLLWDELYLEKDNLFNNINQHYGWLEKAKASEVAEKVRQYSNIDLIYSMGDGKIKLMIDNFQHDVSLILTTYNELTFTENCDYEKIDSFRYLVTMKKNIATIGVK